MTEPAGGGYGADGAGDRAAPPSLGGDERYVVGERGVARIAAWPLETLDGLRSPALVAAVRAWTEERAAVAAEGRALARVVGVAVPGLGAADRRAALALRRRLHAGVAPLPEVTLALVDALGPDGPSVLAHRRRRQRLADDEAALRAEHERRRHVERAGFVAATATPAFRTALAAGAPGLWQRFADDDPSPDRPPTARATRRERAVLGHLLRAVGRPVPSGRWAGLAPVEPADEADKADEANPQRGGDGGRQDMGTPAPPWPGAHPPHAEDQAGDPRLTASPVVAAAEGGDVVIPDLAPWLALSDVGATGWPASATNPWSVVDALASLPPPGPVQVAWEEAAAATRAAAQRAEAALAALDAPGVAAALGAADAALADLAGAVGRTTPSGPSLRVDHRLPVVAHWTVRDRRRHARAIGALDQLAGVDQGPELWRRASVARLGLAAGQDAPVADVARTLATGDGRRPGHQVADRVRVFDRFGPEVAGLAGALAARWERLLEARHDRAEVDLGLDDLVGVAGDLDDRAPVGLGPGGSVLVEPAGPAAWRYLGLRPAPAAYAAAHPTVAGPVVAQAQTVVGRWSSADGVPTVEVVPTDAANPTAAVTPPSTSTRAMRDDLVDPHVGWAVHVDRWDRAWLVDDAGRMHEPVVPHLSAVGTTDPVAAVVATAAGSFGGEVPAGVFPLLPAERDRWRHLPRLTVDGNVVVARERVVVDAAELAEVADRSDPFDRFAAWVDLVRRHRLPADVTARTSGSPNEPGVFVPTDSILAADAFLHGHVGGDGPPQVVMEHGPTVDDALAFPDGTHHVAQLALSWRERRPWDRRPPPWATTGPDAGAGGQGRRRTWCQLDLRFEIGDDGPSIDWTQLAAHLGAWARSGLVHRWYFVRKPPGLRLRVSTDDPSALWAAVGPWRRSLPEGSLVAAEPALYRPELVRFGGADGMAQAHRLWAASAPVAVALESADPDRSARYAVAAVTARVLVGRVLPDAEQSAFWAVQAGRFAGPPPAPSPEVAAAVADPDAWAAGLAPAVASVLADLRRVHDRHRAGLRRQARDLPGDVPPARWLADVVLFQWNAFGLGRDERAMAAMVAAAG